jgi:hypothetical protein
LPGLAETRYRDFPEENCDMNDATSDEDESFAEETLIQAIENQLEAGEPAAAQATLNKLTLVGYERDEILKLMALVLAREIRQMLEQDRAFDVDSYESQLRNLPDLAE